MVPRLTNAVILVPAATRSSVLEGALTWEGADANSDGTFDSVVVRASWSRVVGFHELLNEWLEERKKGVLILE